MNTKYPFLDESKNYIKSLNIETSFEEHLIYSSSLPLGKARVVNAFNGVRTDFTSELDVNILLSYYNGRILAQLAGGRILTRFAEFESECMTLSLFNEVKDIRRVQTELGLNLSNNIIIFTEYLELMSSLAKTEVNYKLVNRLVEDGWVVIRDWEKPDITREAIKREILKPLNLTNITPNFRILSTEIVNELTREDLKVDNLEESAIPPCIQNMLTDLGNSKVSHNSMFVLATFFINLNLPIDSVVELFSRFPRFNREKTRYQLKFLSGEVGTRYSCPGCSTIQSYGLCPGKCGVSYPIHFYKDHMTKEIQKLNNTNTPK